jgi:UTP--glucose-1-phosphate uridylyltransferase
MTNALSSELAALPTDLRARLQKLGFRPGDLENWGAGIGKNRDLRNRLAGDVTAPAADDVDDAAPIGTGEHARLAQQGLDALKRGELALCVLAGGMATRMGSVVKALVEALPGKDGQPGQTFLDLRLREREVLSKRAGREIPLWLMTSEATDGPIREALGDRLGKDVETFLQCASLRLTPEGTLFRDEAGEPDVYATGHGDLPAALRASGLLERFLAERGRGAATKPGEPPYVWIANLDNLGASIDEAILGWHVDHGHALSVELVDKVEGDRGGIPIRWNGKPIVAEEFRLPLGFDPTAVRVFNTNTFLVSAAALASVGDAFTYVEVEKTVAGKKAIQFERLLGEITTMLPPRFVRVPRQGPASRFLPVKDVPELERRRSEIDEALRARGIL